MDTTKHNAPPHPTTTEEDHERGEACPECGREMHRANPGQRSSGEAWRCEIGDAVERLWRRAA